MWIRLCVGSGKLAGNLPVDVKLIMTATTESAKPIYQHVQHVGEFLRLHGITREPDLGDARMLARRPPIVNARPRVTSRLEPRWGICRTM